MGDDRRVVTPSTPAAAQRIRLVSAPVRSDVSSLRLGDDVPGDAIVVRRSHLERGGRPWFPVAGEYHFARTDPARWREDLAALRSNGITLVSTYVLWILHQEAPGAVCWDGALDVRRFVEEARSVGLEVVLRIGPWAHGETRNGGFPDWVQTADVVHRTNDPGYLELVRPWIGAIADELNGLFRSASAPSVPIVAIQVENELYDQPEHLTTLHEMAVDAGMSAPLWTATGWGGAQLPADEFLPVYAGYADGFWEGSDAGWPANYAMHFRFTAERDDLGVGADVRASGSAASGDADAGAGAGADDDDATDPDAVPYATCELGGGMPPAYHRRPLVEPDDVAAIALAKLASGSVFQGYYLYHGGLQVIGEHSSTQESQATGYPNDLPLRDYDFAAPLGAFGQRRRHADLLRLQHLFLQSAGAELAPLPPAIAEGDLRTALRADDEQGFLFFSTYQPAVAPLPGAVVQFELSLGEHRVVLPSDPTLIDPGEYFVWPVRRPLAGGGRFSATAQLVTEIEVDGVATVVLFQTARVPVEIVHETADGTVERIVVDPSGVPLEQASPMIGGARFIVLDAHTAESLWQGRIDGVDHLVFTTADTAFADGLTVRTGDEPTVFATLPPLERPAAGVRTIDDPAALFARYELDAVPDSERMLDVVLEREAQAPAPVRHGGSAGRLSAPRDEDFEKAAHYRVALPDRTEEGERVILRIDWIGDVGRALLDGVIVSDQFWSGRAWEIDVSGASGDLHLQLLPWDPSSAVHLDPRMRPLADEVRLAVRGARLERSRVVRVTA